MPSSVMPTIRNYFEAFGTKPAAQVCRRIFFWQICNCSCANGDKGETPPMHPKRILAALLTIVLFSIVVPICFSQTESATISGRVTDSSGAIVRGVSVKLTSAERGTTQESITNDAGIYVFPNVRPGVYHITVMRQGFQQVNYPSLVANVQDHIEQNFKLKVGSSSESVTVTGSETK